MGSLRREASGSMTAIINLKPAIVRDILNLFYNRASDTDFQLKRAVRVRIDIPNTPDEKETTERYKIIRVAFE